MRTVFLASLLAFFSCVALGQAQFDVASVKANDLSQRGGEGSRRESVVANPGTVTMVNVTLKAAIAWAYHVNDYQVSGPGWLGDARFDISGRAPASAGEPQLRAMLQTLLANRFKLAVHHETKEMQSYALVVDKGGLKMTPSTGAGPGNLQPDGLKLVASATTVGEVADFLTNVSVKLPVFNIPVIDATGLKGRYDFTIDAAGFLDTIRGAAGAGQVPPADLILDGVQEVLKSQLGLKAELRKIQGDYVVVDHAERVPAEN
jgi:uncharacterized protein (TIGR03435 family)